MPKINWGGVTKSTSNPAGSNGEADTNTEVKSQNNNTDQSTTKTSTLQVNGLTGGNATSLLDSKVESGNSTPTDSKMTVDLSLSSNTWDYSKQQQLPFTISGTLNKGETITLGWSNGDYAVKVSQLDGLSISNAYKMITITSSQNGYQFKLPGYLSLGSDSLSVLGSYDNSITIRQYAAEDKDQKHPIAEKQQTFKSLLLATLNSFTVKNTYNNSSVYSLNVPYRYKIGVVDSIFADKTFRANNVKLHVKIPVYKNFVLDADLTNSIDGNTNWKQVGNVIEGDAHGDTYGGISFYGKYTNTDTGAEQQVNWDEGTYTVVNASQEPVTGKINAFSEYIDPNRVAKKGELVVNLKGGTGTIVPDDVERDGTESNTSVNVKLSNPGETDYNNANFTINIPDGFHTSKIGKLSTGDSDLPSDYKGEVIYTDGSTESLSELKSIDKNKDIKSIKINIKNIPALYSNDFSLYGYIREKYSSNNSIKDGDKLVFKVIDNNDNDKVSADATLIAQTSQYSFDYSYLDVTNQNNPTVDVWGSSIYHNVSAGSIYVVLPNDISLKSVILENSSITQSASVDNNI